MAEIDDRTGLPSGGLNRFRQGDVVDQRISDRGDAADPLQGSAPDEYGAARGGGYTRAWVVHPGERVEHLKEVHESGYQGALGEAGAVQSHHLAHHVDSRLL